MGRDAAGGKPGRLFWPKLNFSVHGGHGADGVEELRRIKRLCADFGVELRFHRAAEAREIHGFFVSNQSLHRRTSLIRSATRPEFRRRRLRWEQTLTDS